MHPEDDREEIQACFRKYRDYLESIKGRLPKSTLEFATADWHYNPEDHRCPHDSWVESVLIEEQSEGKRKEIRWNNIKLLLLNAFHDGHIDITYERVSNYSFKKLSGKSEINPNSNIVGHGDWLYDEIALSENSNVIHEIVFSNNYQWFIECVDIVYRWKPF
jgi:hypothetical protein